MIDNIERALISTLLHTDRSVLSTVELKEDMFGVHLHKLIIKCVKWLISHDKEIDEEIVLYYIQKNNKIDLDEWLRILAQNPFGTKRTINSYLDILKDNMKRRVDEI